MIQVVKKSEREIFSFLNGGLIGGVNLLQVGGARYLHGLTLIFDSPSAMTVTFAASPASAQVALTVPEILEQIATQTLNAVGAKLRDGQLELLEATPTAGVTITAAGTANAKLGFSTEQDTVGTVYNPPDGVPPRVLGVNPSTTADHVLVFIEGV